MIPQLTQPFQWVEGTQKIRNGLLSGITDTDLAFALGGSTLTLGELLRETGDIEASYTASFRTFTQDFAQKSGNPSHQTSVASIGTWWTVLDSELASTLESLTESDLTRTIERGFPMPLATQVDIYLQALLIQMAKISIYLRALNKPLDESFVAFIG